MNNPYLKEAEAIRASIDGLAEGATDKKSLITKPLFRGGMVMA